MKRVLVMFVVTMLAACTGAEQGQDDVGASDVDHQESTVVKTAAFCGGSGDPPCAPGLFCAGGICKSPGQQGALCGHLGDPPCASGLFCTAGVCRAPGGLSAPCGRFGDPPCRAGLFCSGGFCRQG